MDETCACPEGRAAGLSRRSLLRGLLTGGALGAAVTVADGAASTRYAYAADSYAGDVLVVLSLRGGFDGLSAIVPAGDPSYAAARPGIGIPMSQLIRLDTTFGLHPALGALKPFWDRKMFGAVHAVGQVNPTRSHFQAMQTLEQAAPGSSERSGWLDRTIGVRTAGTPFQSAQIGSTQVGQALAGPNPEISMPGVADFTLGAAWDETQRGLWTKALKAMHKDGAPAVKAPAMTTLGALETAATLTAQGYTPAGGATYPEGALGDSLKDVARLIKAGVGLQVACVDEGDWDMHAGLGEVDDGWMFRKLTELGSALAAFATDLGSRMGKVTVVTLSEFGRRVGENGSGGVDHGHGNAVLLLGGGVAGGKVHGDWPGLADDDLVDGDLDGTTDYRQVLGEILTQRCGVTDLGAVFPGLKRDFIGVTAA